jgi:hypothetical protein
LAPHGFTSYTIFVQEPGRAERDFASLGTAAALKAFLVFWDTRKGDVYQNLAPQGAEPDHESEKGPSEEEYAKSASHFFLVKHIAIEDAEPRDQDGSIGEPEGAVGREGRGTEGVPGLELPHANQKLGDATIEDGKADHAGRALERFMLPRKAWLRRSSWAQELSGR